MIRVRVETVSTEGDPESSTIGGFDHNFPRAKPGRAIINRFLRSVTRRWPRATFEIHDETSHAEVRVSGKDLPVDIPETGYIHIVRDELMAHHAEEEGAVPMPDGESSLILWFRRVAPDTYYLDLVTVSDPLENDFCWWAVEEIWEAYLSARNGNVVEEQ